MKSASVFALLVLGLITVSFGRKEETVQELVARAEAAKPDQQPNLYMAAAERQRRAANDAMKADHWEEFRSDVQDIVKYCDRAHKAAITSNKHIKDTEIKIRQISTHLKETKMNVDVDDQPAVQSAIDQLEQYRTDLLRSMFGGKSND